MELAHTLSLGYILHQLDVSYRLLLVPGERDGIGNLAIVCCPIGLLIIIGHVVGLIVAFCTCGAHLIRAYCSLRSKVCAQTLADELARLCKGCYRCRRQHTSLIGRYVKDKCSVATYGFQIHLEQALGSVRTLAIVIEPSAVGGFSITLAREPEPSVLCSVHAITFGRVITILGAPVSLSGPSSLIANPTGLSANTPKHAVGAHLMHGITEVGHIIVCSSVDTACTTFSTIIATAAVGTIKPHFKLVGAILGNLGTLAEEDLFDVAVGAIERTVAVPRRDIEAIFHIQVAGSLGKVARNIDGTAILVARVGDIVVGRLGRPQAETIVVLHHGNATTHASSFGRLEPLARIGCCRGSKGLAVFVSIAPFKACVSVHAIVKEGIILRFLPFELARMGHRMHGERFVVRIW